MKRLISSRFVRWCNGNTAPFGGVIHGSNPCRPAIFTNEIAGSLDVCTKLAQQPARSAERRGGLAVVLARGGDENAGRGRVHVLATLILIFPSILISIRSTSKMTMRIKVKRVKTRAHRTPKNVDANFAKGRE